AQPVVPPPEGVRSDLEIVQGLAQRVGLDEAMDGDARAWKRRLAEKRLAPHGITLETLEEGPMRNPLAPGILFADRKFATPSGRVNLMTEAPPSEEPCEEYPLFLMALSTEKAQSSQWATPQE